MCSAFALHPGWTTAIVTANHCLNRTVRDRQSTLMLEGVGGLPTITCRLAHAFASPDDAAILECSDYGTVAGLVPADTGTRAPCACPPPLRASLPTRFRA